MIRRVSALVLSGALYTGLSLAAEGPLRVRFLGNAAMEITDGTLER